ncbi:uncharacterized protein LOC134707625 isoform X2 [Mytilus trossulus]|uniref:uncharacterized protein LOC134707625 isoform X2 n=1 Tax=Mytilus trossulus TaxID=6551 RepID=UPI0030078A08
MLRRTARKRKAKGQEIALPRNATTRAEILTTGYQTQTSMSRPSLLLGPTSATASQQSTASADTHTVSSHTYIPDNNIPMQNADGSFQMFGPNSRYLPCSNSTRIYDCHFRPLVTSLIESSIAPSTLQIYQRGQALFYEFRSLYGLMNTWPIPLCELLSFIAYLFKKELSHSTINCYVTGLGFFSKANNYEDVTQKFVVRKLLEGIKRSRPKKNDLRLPITRDMLKSIIFSLACVCKTRYELSLFKAAFSLAFHGLFRVGELVVTNSLQGHTLQISDIHIVSGLLQVCITSSKTDQLGKGSNIWIYPQSDLNICPVNLVSEFIKLRPPVLGPLFCHFDGSPLSRYQFVTLLKNAIDLSGIDKTRYSSHSFRIGAATTLSMDGVSDSEIMRLGRWSSNAYKGYIRI